MTQDEIIRMAREECGFAAYGEETGQFHIPVGAFWDRLERFAALVAEAERNRIADFIEHGHSDDECHNIQYAQSIRGIK